MQKAHSRIGTESSLATLRAMGARTARALPGKQWLIVDLYRSGEVVTVDKDALEEKFRSYAVQESVEVLHIDTRDEQNAEIWDQIDVVPGTPKLVLLVADPDNPQWPWRRVGPTLPAPDADAVDAWLGRCRAAYRTMTGS